MFVATESILLGQTDPKARWEDLVGWTLVAIEEPRVLVWSDGSPASICEGGKTERLKKRLPLVSVFVWAELLQFNSPVF